MTRIFPKGTPPDQIAAAVSVLVRGLDQRRSWQVTIQPFRSRRSSAQNAFLYGVVYPAFLEGGGEALGGWSKEDLHEFMLGEWAGWETLSIGGRTVQKPFRRSSSFSKQEFSDYLEFIAVRAAELNIVIPEPDYGDEPT
jgi:hypothetical protein